MTTPEQIRAMRRQITGLPPDSLPRVMLLEFRALWLQCLWRWEYELEESMQAAIEQKAVDVAATSVPQLAKVTARAVFAVAFPLIVFSVLAGFAAGLAVSVFRFTLSLFF